MAKPSNARGETLSVSGGWIAAGVIAVSGGLLLWNKLRGDATTPPSSAPREQPVCDPGSAYDPASGLCVATGTPSAPSSGPTAPSFLPEPSQLKEPMLPPHGTILMVGGEIAVGLAEALATELMHVEATSGYPVTPSAITVYDGAPVLYSFEALAAGLGISGVPKAPECQACPPDLVIFFTGEVNLHWGPLDDGTRKAITALTDAFAITARDHYPNLLWVGPPSNPDETEPLHAKDLGPMIVSAAQLARPLRSAFLNPKRFERAYPNSPVPVGAEAKMLDTARPNAAGYADLARQVAQLLTAWYAKHPQAQAVR